MEDFYACRTNSNITIKVYNQFTTDASLEYQDFINI